MTEITCALSRAALIETSNGSLFPRNAKLLARHVSALPVEIQQQLTERTSRRARKENVYARFQTPDGWFVISYRCARMFISKIKIDDVDVPNVCLDLTDFRPRPFEACVRPTSPISACTTAAEAPLPPLVTPRRIRTDALTYTTSA